MASFSPPERSLGWAKTSHGIQKKTYNRQKKTSKMWEFFEKKSDRLVLCKLCLKNFKYSNNTSNMKDHMVRKHPDYLLQPCSSENLDEINPELTSPQNEPVSPAQFYSANSSRKKYLDSMFVKLIAIDMQPLRLAEHEGMREFIKALDSKYQLPSRSVISNNLLPKLYTNLKLQLFELLKDVKEIAVTTDMWTSSSNQGVCAITIHFINKQKLQTALLAAIVLEGSHNADKIASVLDNVLQEWNCRNKVIALVTDNAATMVKVAEVMRVRHVPCFAHSLNLVMKDVLSAPGLKELVEKSSRIVTHFKHSTLASDKLRSVQREMNKPELKLIKYVETRWNSAFYMLNRILQVRPELTLVLNEYPSAPENLTPMEYAYLEEIQKIFEPLETCTEGISGDEYVTISLIIPLIKGLSLKMVELENGCNSDFVKEIIECMKTSVQNKLKFYESRSPCMISTLLNPHFKRLGFKTPFDAEKAISLVKKEYATYLSSLTSQTLSPASTSQVSQETAHSLSAKKSKLSRLLSFVDNQHENNATSVTADAIIDMRQYLEKPTLPFSEYPIEYWYHQENQLKHIALKYLCIPGSSVPSERVFSKAGLLITDRRNRLSAKHINELLFINMNQKLF